MMRVLLTVALSCQALLVAAQPILGQSGRSDQVSIPDDAISSDFALVPRSQPPLSFLDPIVNTVVKQVVNPFVDAYHAARNPARTEEDVTARWWYGVFQHSDESYNQTKSNGDDHHTRVSTPSEVDDFLSIATSSAKKHSSHAFTNTRPTETTIVETRPAADRLENRRHACHSRTKYLFRRLKQCFQYTGDIVFTKFTKKFTTSGSARADLPRLSISKREVSDHRPGVVEQQYFVGESLSSRGGTKGAVACEHKICAQVGIDLLRQGGNAADALVGTVFCVGVVAPYHSGIGGGSFSLVRRPRPEHARQGTDSLDGFEVLDYREVAPAASHKDMFKGRERKSVLGALAVAVPGEVRGLARLHGKYGSLPWSTVLQGAIKLARDGFPVHKAMYNFMTAKTANHSLVDDPAWAVDFAPHGTLLKVGETITMKRLADTLTKIQQDPESFYKGDIAESIVRTLREGGGIVTLEDLANYTVESRRPLTIDHHGYRLVGVGAPASGAVSLSVLNIVGGYKDTADRAKLNISYHRLMEAFRFAFSERTLLGDPAFVDNMDVYQENMLNESTAAHIRSRITDETHEVNYYNPSGIDIPTQRGTSHIVASDASGLSISTTSTINDIFGSLVRDNETGIIFNNEMNDFSIPSLERNIFGFISSPSNYIAPGKRPLSSMSPVIVEDSSDGSLVLLTGAAGGSRIITATTQYLWHELDRGMLDPDVPLGFPLAHPRFHDQLIPYEADFETGFRTLLPGVVADLERRGHNISLGERQDLGRVSAIRFWAGRKDGRGEGKAREGWFEASADPRQVDGAGLTV